jgi:mannose-1-phosphate guanylyltransferase
MKALVLAAGKGSRLAGAAGNLPKPLVDVGGTTPLQHVLAWASGFARDRLWINVHEHGDVVRARIGDEVAGVPVRYSHEPELLGTAGAWYVLREDWTGTSLVLYGDNFMRFSLHALLERHRAAGRLATVALFDPAVHANTGIGGGRVALDGDRITRFVEGGAEGLINAGAYLLEPGVAAVMREGFSDFGHDVLPLLAEHGELTGHVLEAGAYCLGVDTPERLAIARRMLAATEVAQ